MTTPTLTQAREALHKLADEYASAAAKTGLESLYGTSKSYTAECVKFENEARTELLAAIDAALSAQEVPQAVPAEATTEMLDAYRRVVAAGSELDGSMVWRAMLAAAPAAPKQAEVQQAAQPVADHVADARKMVAAQPVALVPLTDAVVNAAREAMDESFEAGNDAQDITIPSHLAAALSLRLDEHDRAHGIKAGKDGAA